MPPWRPPAEPVGGGRPRWRVNGSGDGPLLVGAAVAGPQFELGAVGGAGAGDVHALAVNLQRAVGLDGPGLVGAAVAVPHLDLGAVGGGLTVVVDALGAVV